MAERAAERFEAYVTRLAEVVGHADRAGPLRAYLTGLLLPGERKSVEPMAAKIDPRHVPARHQSMHHFVANAPWDTDAVIAVARDCVFRPSRSSIPIEVDRRIRSWRSGRSEATLGAGYLADLGSFFKDELVLRTDSPESLIRCASWTSRSQIESAAVSSPITPCQRSGSSCVVMIVDARP
jgi:DDE superfamily endonuclease